MSLERELIQLISEMTEDNGDEITTKARALVRRGETIQEREILVSYLEAIQLTIRSYQ